MLTGEDLWSKLSLREAEIQVAEEKARLMEKKAVLHFAKIT